MRRTTHTALALALAGGIIASGCSSNGTTTTATPGPAGPAGSAPGSTAPAAPAMVVPGRDWATRTPADSGLDQAKVDALADLFNDGASNCVTVVKDGYVVAERYWNGTTPDQNQEIFSASKSVTSVLVGIAQDQGKLSIDDKASTYLTEWKGTPSEDVTIKQLLSNSSGRYYDFETDYMKMAIGAPDKTGFALGLSQQHQPGTHWEYNNSAIQTLEAVLERATGEDMERFATRNLFEPIGMTSTIRRDQAGNPMTFMGVQADCRDLARFGWLALNQGQWGDRQIVDTDYMKAATTTSQELNTSYGYLWWVNGERPADPARPGSGGRRFKAAPDDFYAALGLGGQLVLVWPSDGLVVTRIGGAGGGTGGIAQQEALVPGAVEKANLVLGRPPA